VRPNPAPAMALRPPVKARAAAAVGLISFAAASVALIILLIHHAPNLFGSLVCLGLGTTTAWAAATIRRWRLALWALTAGLALGGLVLLIVARDSVIWLSLLVADLVVTGWAGGQALRWEVGAVVNRRWRPASPAAHPVLIMNPRSGHGKVDQSSLAEEARRRAITPVVLGAGDDLRALAQRAVDEGADVIGMAGGDGSQAIVASVACDEGVAYVCVPAGTRNHLALDLGVDRDDVVGSLDAFGEAREMDIDLGAVNGQVFVNNVSLGVYAEIVRSEAYRDDPIGTVSKALPDLLGPDAEPFDLSLDGPDGQPLGTVQIVLVSNNRYQFHRLGALGSRPRLDGGEIGIAALHLGSPVDVTAFLALEAAGHLERFPGWYEWAAPSLVIGSGSTVNAAVDGEATEFEAPLRFSTHPQALRVRTALHHPGASPAALRPGLGRSTFLGMARVLTGRPSGLIETLTPPVVAPS